MIHVHLHVFLIRKYLIIYYLQHDIIAFYKLPLNHNSLNCSTISYKTHAPQSNLQLASTSKSATMLLQVCTQRNKTLNRMIMCINTTKQQYWLNNKICSLKGVSETDGKNQGRTRDVWGRWAAEESTRAVALAFGFLFQMGQFFMGLCKVFFSFFF